MNHQLVNAIGQHRIVEFEYNGHRRVAEPHVYGVHDGREQVLCYQIEGGSVSGGSLPDWRRFDLRSIHGLVVTDRKFGGSRPNPSGQHTVWDMRFAVVS